MDFLKKLSKRASSEKKKQKKQSMKSIFPREDDGYHLANVKAFQKSLKALVGHYKTEQAQILIPRSVS